MKKQFIIFLLLVTSLPAAILKVHNPVGAAATYFGDNSYHYLTNVLVYDANVGNYIINSYAPEGPDNQVQLPDDLPLNCYVIIYFYTGDTPYPEYLFSGFDYYQLNQDGTYSDNGDILQYDTTNFNSGLDKPYLIVAHEKGTSMDWNTQLLYFCIGFGLAVPYIGFVLVARYVKAAAGSNLSGGAS